MKKIDCKTVFAVVLMTVPATVLALPDFLMEGWTDIEIPSTAYPELQARDVILYNRGNSLQVRAGGFVQCTNMSLYGESTQGVAYPNLMNTVSVSGTGSFLNVVEDLSLWSPDAPGQPGDPFDIPREIPTSMSISAGGRVVVGGEVSVENGSWISLGVGGRLETPMVMGNLIVRGTFAPGLSPGDSVVDGGLTVAGDGTLEMELGGYTAGTQCDRLTVNSLSELDGTLEFVFLDSFSPTNGARFDVFNWTGGKTGEFSAINAPGLGDGLEWDVSMLYTDGTLTVIPEPGTFALLAVFGGGLLMFRRASRR